MKTILSLCSVLLISILFTSCVKNLEVVTPVQTGNTVTGNWYVSSASENNGSGWVDYNAQLPGEFSFFTNGTAAYTDNAGELQGAWSSYVVNTDYYDENGNYESNSHNDFKIDVSAGDGTEISLYFDDISFYGSNQFTATYYDGKTLERYVFNRD